MSSTWGGRGIAHQKLRCTKILLLNFFFYSLLSGSITHIIPLFMFWGGTVYEEIIVDAGWVNQTNEVLTHTQSFVLQSSFGASVTHQATSDLLLISEPPCVLMTSNTVIKCETSSSVTQHTVWCPQINKPVLLSFRKGTRDRAKETGKYLHVAVIFLGSCI